MACCKDTALPEEDLTCICQIVSDVLTNESDYYAKIAKDHNCIGNRNVVIKLFDCYVTVSKIVQIAMEICTALLKNGFDVTDGCPPQVQVTDTAEGVSKRCVVIRTSQFARAKE